MKGLRIRPELSGLRVSLFDLEADVMEVIWGHNEPEIAVAQVLAVLSAERKIAYTTVMTTVSRLHDKGLLLRRKDGRRYLYRPRMSQAGFLQEMTRQVLDSLPPPGRQTAMALLVERLDDADDAELAQLQALIDARRARGGKG